MKWLAAGETNRQSWARALAAAFPDESVLFVETLGWNPIPSPASVVSGQTGGRLIVLQAWNPAPLAGRPWNTVGRRVNALFTKAAVRRAERRFGLGRADLCVCLDPLGWRLVMTLGAERRIYDCLDDYAAQPQYASPRVGGRLRREEERLTAVVDETWTSSVALARRFRATGVPARCAYGSVSRPAWASRLSRPTRAPSEPITAIYVGALDTYKVDHRVFRRLVDDLAQHIRLVVIGGLEFSGHDVERTINWLNTHERVDFRGAIGRNEIGDHLAAADFGLVAMTKSRYSEYSFPLKYWDYQWAELPTLAVAAPELRGLPGVVSCDSPDEIDGNTIRQLLDLRSSAGEMPANAAAHDARARIARILSA